MAAFFVSASLALAACSNGCSFRPDPNTNLDLERLDELIAGATAPFDFEERDKQALPVAGDLPSCWDVASGPCSIAGARPAGMQAFYRDPEGLAALVLVLIAEQGKQATEQMTAHAQNYETLATGTLRLVEAQGMAPTRTCNVRAKPTSDHGCAWRQRSQPRGVGDKGKSFSTTDKVNGGSAVLFVRGPLFALVQVRGNWKQAYDLADRLASSLDGQFKQALSR